LCSSDFQVVPDEEIVEPRGKSYTWTNRHITNAARLRELAGGLEGIHNIQMCRGRGEEGHECRSAKLPAGIDSSR
jgi:hypothetical protein